MSIARQFVICLAASDILVCVVGGSMRTVLVFISTQPEAYSVGSWVDGEVLEQEKAEGEEDTMIIRSRCGAAAFIYRGMAQGTKWDQHSSLHVPFLCNILRGHFANVEFAVVALGNE